jgi:Flp pilus assembly protein TadD
MKQLILALCILILVGYTPVLGQVPDSSEAHDNSGVALYNKGDHDGAIAEFREALRLNPNDYSTHYHLAVALANKHDLTGEISELREALRLNPNYGPAHYNLGVALAYYPYWSRREKVRNINKKDVEMMIGKHWENVIAEFREAARLMPKKDEAHYELGVYLERAGDRAGAFNEYRIAYTLKPDNKEYERAYKDFRKRNTTWIPIPIPIP